MNWINLGRTDSSLQHYLRSFSGNILSSPQDLGQGGRGERRGFYGQRGSHCCPHFPRWPLVRMTERCAVLDVPIFVAAFVCSSGPAAICTFLEWRELGFTDGKGLAPGWRANVAIAYVAPVPICLPLLSNSMPVPCCRMQSVPWLEFVQETVANTPTPFFMQTWFMTLILF